MLVGIIIFLIAGGCGRAQKSGPETQDSYQVSFAVEPAQPVVGPSTLVLTLADASGEPVTNATVAIEANMSHAGMVPVNAAATDGQGGVFRVPLAWTMGGDWYVDAKFTLPDGKIVIRRFPVVVK